ncbi:hypothetical protein J6590_067231 [Homalodisca vitripennis]|nr:hypothetical protein J6590_067231 [Homalodisca vitripennis]
MPVSAKGQPSINVISRDISGLNPEVGRRVDAVLRVNGICPEQLTVINRRDCPCNRCDYPCNRCDCPCYADEDDT